MQRRIKLWSENAFFRSSMTFSQSLMVIDGAIKLDCASVIFVDSGLQSMKLNLILLPQLLPVMREVSGSSYLGKTIAESTQNTPVYNICVSQGSVATRLRFNGNSQIVRRACL